MIWQRKIFWAMSQKANTTLARFKVNRGYARDVTIPGSRSSYAHWVAERWVAQPLKFKVDPTWGRAAVKSTAPTDFPRVQSNVFTIYRKQLKRDRDGSLWYGKTTGIQATKPGFAVPISCQVTLNHAVFLGKIISLSYIMWWPKLLQ